MTYDEPQDLTPTSGNFPAKSQARYLTPNSFHPDGFTAPPSSRGPWTKETLAQTPFADLPVYIPDLKKVLNTDGALNAAALNANENGVVCIISAWLNQDEFDFVRAEVNGLTVDTHTVTKDEAETGAYIVLFLKKIHFIDQAPNTLQFFVTKIGGGTDQTKLFSILVDAIEPVGPDSNLGQQGNNEMAPVRFVNQAIEDFKIITAEQAGAGVEVIIERYPLNPNRPSGHRVKEGDVIRMSVGGHIVEKKVTSGEATSTLPLRMWLYFGVWSAVGDGEHAVEWGVVDEAGNLSPGFSPVVLVTVQIGSGTEPLLPAPLAEEGLYDPEANLDYLDLKTFDGDVRVEVGIRNNDYLVNDRIRLTAKGLSADGIMAEITLEHLVTQPNAIRAELDFPRSFFEQLVDGRALFTYKRIRANVADRPSRSALYLIKGDPVGNQLPPPQVKGLVNGALPDPTNPVHIVVKKYLGQLPTDRVDLVIIGYLPNGSTRYDTYTEAGGTDDIEYFLDWSSFAMLVGGYFTAHYVINGGGGRPPSESVTIPVGDVMETLPAPKTLQAVFPEFQFDPGKHLANLNIRVSPHPAIVEGVTVTVYAEGSQPNGSFTSAPFPVTENWVGVDIPSTMPRVNVLANLNRTLKLYYKVQPASPGSIALTSQSLTVSVGMKVDVTTPPELLETTPVSPGLVELNPVHVLQSEVTTFRVTYSPMLPSDNVKLHIGNVPGVGTPDIEPKAGIPDTGTNYITFEVHHDWVAAYLGHKADVYFVVTRDHNDNESAHLTVDVKTLPQQLLEVVTIPEAMNGVVDGNATAHVKIEKWPYIRQGQAVHIDLETPSDNNLLLRPGVVVSAAEFLAKQTMDLIPKSYLTDLPNGSVMTVQAKVSMDGMGNKDTAIALSPVSYSIAGQAEIIGTIPVGQGPILMAITPDSKTLYVANIDAGTTTVIDTQTQKIVTTLATTGCYGISVSKDGTRVYISRLTAIATSQVFVYSAISHVLIGSFNTSKNYWPEGLLASADNKKLYACVSQNEFHIYNLPGYSLAKSIYLGVRPKTMYSDIERKLIYVKVSGPGVNYYLRFDPNGDSFLGYTPDLGGIPQAISFHGNRPRAFYTIADKVGSLDTALNKVVGELAGFSAARGIACHPTLDLAYVADNLQHTVTVIDTSTDSPKELYKLNDFNGPTEVLASPDGKRVYVINLPAAAISVIRT